eukprot:TRINITY_DN1311_c0_g1_i1.p1 TRINITY_DN1311_c0_g1~~TRINITY_DN1311_c0_g1_i1.p1  ORF type:complete len:703 (+),score=229.25 TRINITY_DN1311_c0_g1_i1:235-2343(+)
MIGVMFGLGLAFPSLAVPGTYEVMAAYNRFAQATRAQMFVNEFVYTTEPENTMMADQLTWNNASDASEIRYWLSTTVENFKLISNALKYGNDSMHLPGHPEKHPDIYWLIFDYQCHLAGMYPNCFGLDALISVYVRDINDILAATTPVSIRSPTVERCADLMGTYMDQLQPGAVFKDDGELTITLRQAAAIYKLNTLDTIASIDAPLLALFILTFPVLVMSFLILRPLETRIREENIRMMKMLLMVPGEVIVTVPALVEYLETGKQENAQQKLKEILDEYMARNESIIKSSVDGIVVMNAAKQIELFSPAAQAIFGYTEEEVKGKNVSILMPESIAVHHDAYVESAVRAGELSEKTLNKSRELPALRKDGKQFPIFLTLNLLKINDKVLMSAFIRDISNQKEKEGALAKEKAKSEKLLQALLPSVIADQLREEGVNPSSEQLLHAEGYKEVSVLFADLVGFTKMSAGISPTELVFTLNKLFSMFDMLCDKYSLEKIKTIGDCYMVAGGCPERSLDHPQRMLEFAIEMLEKLHSFNAEYGRQLKLRIGINVGPVVAGVLGLKKITYDLWGDAVNVASRMESSGVENRIQVSHAAFELLSHDYLFEERGKMEIKGKGLMLTYLYKDRKLSKTASGKVFRRALLTPPPGVDLLRRGSEDTVAQPAQPEAASSSVSMVAQPSVDDDINSFFDAEIRQKPSVDGSTE